MIKIRALNRDSLSDEDAPTIRREAQEEIALDMYNKALRHQCNGNYEEAVSILEKLLTENIPQLESQGGLPKTMSTLKYSCYFNVGNIYVQKKNDSDALDNFLKAADLDSSDVTLWHKIGTIALKLDRFRQAAYAFLKGLECNESHWPCLDKLISVLYAIQDTVTCLLYIGKALVLDKDYIKGHVVRKLIFESNPAAKEYYQAYNPDYILEPDFDGVVTEEDEKMIIKNLEPLCKRLNEVEKSFGPKPLPCIALPTALQDFTWVSLGKTILNLHNYITENKLSYFSKVDITKCMSREYTDVEAVPIENTAENSNENVIDAKPIVLPSTEPQTMEVENEVKPEDNFEQRRPSLSSENNNLSEPNCSQGEDNDEMDQDTEDQEDNSEQKEEKKRTAKRKRDLLSDLQIWGWHSKRKSAKKGKSEKDFTIQGALTRIIPSYLLPNGINIERNKNFDKNKGIDNIFTNFKSQLSSTSVNFEKYFGTENEKNDVTNFWTKEREHLDVVDLIEEYTVSLAKMWNKKWPKELISLYLKAYDKYREHFEHPELFNGLSSFEEIKNDALVTLMYGEIVYFYLKTEDKDKRKVHPTSLIQLQLLSTWKEQWQEDYFIMFVRIHWLRAYVLKGLSNHTLAICAYQLVI
ncbi:calcineurin-binding protein cabin-1-like [Agrilus planipennis]|uniref:Calcineurin-binding protein cabin-1-like n=1 Tax=Agrilus planipennis TaxID=224129 RepID=A0A7F5RKJ1_AGRPL|nr:calcineurin-binding protein cabin-1-like [Agrilus planipennis]